MYSLEYFLIILQFSVTYQLTLRNLGIGILNVESLVLA
jgi:hypothetical protein